jgi:hypothetical protein
MNQQEWISQWITQDRATPVGPEFIDLVMNTVTTPSRKFSFMVAFMTSLSRRISQRTQVFQSRSALITTGTLGGLLHFAVFFYVLLFA